MCLASVWSHAGTLQLAPIMKMNLATLGPCIRWMILLYGTPVLYAPRKWMKWKNIIETFFSFSMDTSRLGDSTAGWSLLALTRAIH